METFDISKIIVGDGFSITRMKQTDNEVVISAESTSRSCCCPFCGVETSKPAGTYKRRPQDLPIGNRTTWLDLKARRYACMNPECKMGSFSEPIEFLGRSAQRTDRLDTAILSTSVFMGASTTSIVLSWIGIQISHQGVQDIQNRCVFPDDSDVEHVGIDDFSTHKGMEYDTVLVSGDDHHVITVIKGRDYQSVREMFKSFPKLKLINRDRDGTYAKAIRDSLPNCEQIADPFHLTKNLLDSLKELFKVELDTEFFFHNGELMDKPPKKVSVLRVKPDSNKLAALPYDNTPVVEQGKPIIISQEPDLTGREAVLLNNKISKLDNITTVQQIAGSGKINYSAVARQLGLCPATVKTYSTMPVEQVEALREQVSAGLTERMSQKMRTPATFDPLIYKALDAREAPETVYSLCVHNGYTGPVTAMERRISDIGQEYFGLGIQQTGFAMKYAYPPEIHRVKQSDVLKYMTIRDRSRMEKSLVARYYKDLKEAYPIIAEADATFSEWRAIRQQDGRETVQEYLDAFIAKHNVDGDIAKSFAKGLKSDYDAVLNGMAMKGNFTSAWVEGVNRKSKVAENVMYGRAKTPYLSVKLRLGSDTYKGTATIQDLYRRPKGRAYGPCKNRKAS